MKNKTLRNDLIILGILVVLIGGLFLFKSKQQGAKIVIKRNDQIEGYYSLDDDQIINIDNENKIQIKNHEVFMIKATCPDHLCIKQGKINKKGATIVCLPHQLVVEVIEGNEGKDRSFHYADHPRYGCCSRDGRQDHGHVCRYGH